LLDIVSWRLILFWYLDIIRGVSPCVENAINTGMEREKSLEMDKKRSAKINSDKDTTENGPAVFDSQNAQPAPNDLPEAENRVKALEKKIESLEQESKASYDRLLRISAEFDNYKKRIAREMEDFRKYANEFLLVELLSVADNLERAVDSAKSDASERTSIIEGVSLTLKDIGKIFEKFGVEPIDCVGKPFDPAHHQAVLQEENEEHDEVTVLKELQRGYRYKDRLLRPAMVVVSKSKKSAIPKEEPEPADSIPEKS